MYVKIICNASTFDFKIEMLYCKELIFIFRFEQETSCIHSIYYLFVIIMFVIIFVFAVLYKQLFLKYYKFNFYHLFNVAKV